MLSGGERNRLMLAKLFAKPSNLLVMDEPTNDLDAETLDLLEELVADYAGTLLLVSHDRAFLDNVVTSTLVFEGEGRIGEYVGGYSDAVRQRQARAADQNGYLAGEAGEVQGRLTRGVGAANNEHFFVLAGRGLHQRSPIIDPAPGQPFCARDVELAVVNPQAQKHHVR